MYQDFSFEFLPCTICGITLISGNDSLFQSLKNILSTRRGELHYNPKFGCSVHKYLFEKLSLFNALLIQQEIEFAFGNHEKRIVLNSVIVTPDFDNAQYNIDINYDVITTQDTENISFALSIV